MKASAFLWSLTKKIVRIFTHKVDNPAFPTPVSQTFHGLLFGNIYFMWNNFYLWVKVCVKNLQKWREALSEGIFLPWNGAWWRHTEVVQNQVTCPVEVAKLWGYTDIACDFFEVVLCLLGWWYIDSLYSFGRCTSATLIFSYMPALILSMILLGIPYPFLLDSAWVFRQWFSSRYKRRFPCALFCCLLFGLNFIWEKKRNSLFSFINIFYVLSF